MVPLHLPFTAALFLVLPLPLLLSFTATPPLSLFLPATPLHRTVFYCLLLTYSLPGLRFCAPEFEKKTLVPPSFYYLMTSGKKKFVYIKKLSRLKAIEALCWVGVPSSHSTMVWSFPTSSTASWYGGTSRGPVTPPWGTPC